MSIAFHHVRSSRRRGFTLVELLVVVAIIALLVSILLPTLGKAKEMAKLVICQTNMHAIGRAAYMYATENNDYLPRGSGRVDPTDATAPNFKPGAYFFASRFSPYMGGPKIPLNKDMNRAYLDPIFKGIKAYQCPSFMNRGVTVSARQYILTYINNGFNFDNPIGVDNQASASRPLGNLTRAPAELGYIMEFDRRGQDFRSDAWLSTELYTAYETCGYYTDTTLATFVNYDLPFNKDGTPNATESYSIYARMIRADDEQRHGGRTTLIFFDGHSESRWLDADELPFEMFAAYP